MIINKNICLDNNKIRKGSYVCELTLSVGLIGQPHFKVVNKKIQIYNGSTYCKSTKEACKNWCEGCKMKYGYTYFKHQKALFEHFRKEKNVKS